MRFILYIQFIILLVSSVESIAQNRVQLKGDAAFDAHAYVLAQKYYTKAFKRGSREIHLLQRLGDAYYLTGDYENAASWYDRLYVQNDKIQPDYLYKYALSLKSTEQYKKSDEMMAEFNRRANETDVRAELFDANKKYLAEIESVSGKYKIEMAPFNTKNSEFAPAFYGKQLVYASNGEENKIVKSNHTWNNQPMFDLFVFDAHKGRKGRKWRFKGDLNTRYHESTSVFTKDLNTVYFTRNNFTDGWYKQDKSGTNRLKLYRADRIKNNRWKIIELPFNSDEFSIGHPALSPDGKTLYFSSDMPGGKGMSDIYSIAIDGDSYGEPVNLGDKINTEGRDTFPFISNDHMLYFASDGRPGLGGLDVFVVHISEENSKVTNMGSPINSPLDDFTFIINSETNEGYISSNRAGGSDDIYKVSKIEE